MRSMPLRLSLRSWNFCRKKRRNCFFLSFFFHHHRWTCFMTGVQQSKCTLKLEVVPSSRAFIAHMDKVASTTLPTFQLLMILDKCSCCWLGLYELCNCWRFFHVASTILPAIRLPMILDNVLVVEWVCENYATAESFSTYKPPPVQAYMLNLQPKATVE